MNCDQLTQLRTEIITYLDSHPYAADTLMGIAEWWLPRHAHKVSKEDVEYAIKHLVEEGILEAVEQTNGAFIYKRRI